jgi:hypothetical protein
LGNLAEPGICLTVLKIPVVYAMRSESKAVKLPVLFPVLGNFGVRRVCSRREPPPKINEIKGLEKFAKTP